MAPNDRNIFHDDDEMHLFNSSLDLDESYDEVYDEDGNSVFCDGCGGEIKWKNGVYICPSCGKTMSREEFFNYIGAEPPGKECLTCDNLYPGCIICPYGYVDEEF